MTPRFRVTVKDKEIHFDTDYNELRWKDQLARLDGKRALLQIEEQKKQRSYSQNRLYWVWLEVISGHTGHTPDELHKIFKGLFLTPKIVELNGKEYRLSGSTTELTTGAFVEYMMRIEAYAAEMGVVLPRPEDYQIKLNEDYAD